MSAHNPRIISSLWYSLYDSLKLLFLGEIQSDCLLNESHHPPTYVVRHGVWDRFEEVAFSFPFSPAPNFDNHL